MADSDITLDDIAAVLDRRGYIYLPSPALQEVVGWNSEQWSGFAASWDRLGDDRFMADGGRYRRRRHAAFEASAERLRCKVHQPHFQSRDYNPLNGDVQRWFDPVENGIAQCEILQSIFRSLTPFFAKLDNHEPTGSWHSEMHQIRIETSPRELGRPTPEGLHRDGVDWVLVMLIARKNVEDGVTEIGDPDGQRLGRFTLTRPGDAVILDDRRIRHGVTPIRAMSDTEPAYRDALVLTWKASLAA
ncbi:2OG-Fe dioxygenase family protein [Sphingomonas sp. MMSM20]|uniref:2OG-Fe dioxygenase family protein n=1 Tax=Sphingomonas lycopersici TaxID=2951807 RepID=UPI0022387D6B|nr:2OG-Fe dioxygenase family protein [Sphingomonas lycopersici]MCW6530677.1 2OG-Fe dioxygenase family protein [Sphingomonas lycopersici]